MLKNKPRMLIAGGGYADIPMIRAAQSLGFHVITSGNRESDLGHRESDQYCPGDFSDPDVMLRIAREQKIDAICACCNDFSALSASYVAEQIGLPGHDPFVTSKIIHHKDSYRSFAHENGIPAPKAKGFTDPRTALRSINEFSLPFLVKPVDLTGGKGIAKVVDYSQAANAIENAFTISKAKRIVIEEFIEGSRHGFSAILRGGRIVFYFVDDEHYHLSPYLVSGASTPTSCTAASVARLIEYSEAIAMKLDLVDGIFHVQFIQPCIGDPVIIEICRRPPGDLYVELVRHATGVPFAKWLVSVAAGIGIDDVEQRPVNRCITRHCLMADAPGRFSGFNFSSATPLTVIDQMIWARPGDNVVDPSLHKFGILFIEHKSIAQMHDVVPALQSLLTSKVI